ncbi:MAG TPA: LuxR C-terminal-related transcriptional regulator, partial [Acidimicrobiales bacterium]
TAETAAYLNDVMNLTLTAEEVDALEARTEGWIAALQLAGLSMQGRDDVTAFIDSFAGDDRFILDYLVDEVVDRQADDVRTFLLQTAILSRLSAPLCDAVTGQASSKATLALLERANLFLIPLDDRRIWYRYHHLFADVLHARLLDEEPTSVAPLHRRASDWYAQHGDSHEAIRHAMAAHDVERAAELIELAVAAMRQARQEVTLRNWIEALPSELLATRPVLRVGLVGARMASGRFDDVEPTLDDVEQWLDAADRSSGGMVVVDEAEFVRLPAQVAMYRAARSLITGDIPATIAYADRARQLADDDDHLGRGAAAALVGLAQWTLGDLEAAERRYSEAIACFVPAEHHADVLGCTVSLADIQVAQGRLGAAMHTLESVRDIASRHGALRGAADMHVGVAEVLLQRNDLDGARAQLQAAGELGAAAATSQYAYRWRVARACLLELDGDATGALDLLAEAARLYDTDFSPPIRPVPAVIARMQVGQGDLAPALAWAIDRGLAVDDDLTYVHEYEHITLARILLAQGAADPSSAATDDAVRLLRGLLAAAEQGQRTGSVVEILALQALAHDARGDTAAAMGALEQALSGAQGEGFIRVFLDGGAPMARLLRTAVDRGVAVDQARRLLAAGGFTTPEPSARALPPGLVEPLSPRELEILRLLRTDLSGPDIARELTVSLNTVRTHTKNIYTKLGVNNRRAAVRRAAELGL